MTAKADTTTLFVRESGAQSAPAIVFLHGGGLSSRQWQPQMDRLTDYYCIAPDLAEQGQSAEVRPFTLADSARGVAAIISEKVPSRRAHVVGLSLGGAVALEVMRLAPEVVDHLIVTGTAAGLGKILGWISDASAGLYQLMPSEMLLNSAYKQFGIPAEYQPLVHDDLLLSFKPEFTRHFTRELVAMKLPDKATSPTLVVVGQKETIPARQAAHKLVAQLSGARGVMVPGVGHVWNLQAADLFTDMVRAWVSDSPLPKKLQPLK